MKTDFYQPWLHRFAVLTASVALLPIVVGAVVTTMNAGMAFPDWPTSDQQNMFLYPWLESAGDQFVEHGHRLAGVLIGLFSIGLTAFLWWREPRRWVRIVGSLVLVGVILQGILGGARVLQNDRMLALVHGNFAAWVFALMASVALITSRSWFASRHQPVGADVSHLKPTALLLPVLIAIQYFLGGLLRHQHRALHSHLGFAVIVLLGVVFVAIAAHRSGIGWLRRPAWGLLALVLTQAALGAGAWVTRFGFPPLGYVAVQDSLQQILFRTTHTVVGMLVFMTSIIYALRVFRLDWQAAHRPVQKSHLSHPVSMTGGAG